MRPTLSSTRVQCFVRASARHVSPRRATVFRIRIEMPALNISRAALSRFGTLDGTWKGTALYFRRPAPVILSHNRPAGVTSRLKRCPISRPRRSPRVADIRLRDSPHLGDALNTFWMLSKPPRTASRIKEKERERESETERFAAAYALLWSSLSSVHLPCFFSLSLANIAHAPIIAVNGGILRIPELSQIHVGERRHQQEGNYRCARIWLRSNLLAYCHPFVCEIFISFFIRLW